MDKKHLAVGVGAIVLVGVAVAWAASDHQLRISDSLTNSAEHATTVEDASLQRFSDDEIKLSFSYPASLGAAAAEEIDSFGCTGTPCIYKWVKFGPSRFNWSLWGADFPREQEKIVQWINSGSLLPENLRIEVRNDKAIKETELDKGWNLGRIKSAQSTELKCETSTLIYSYGSCSNITIGNHQVMRIDYTAPTETVDLTMDPGPADIEYYLYHPTLNTGMRITYASGARYLWTSYGEQIDRKAEVGRADKVIRDIISSLSFTN